MAVSKCPCSTFSNVMFKQMPRSHWFLSINSQYLQPYWLLQQTSEHTKIQSHKDTYAHTTDRAAIFSKQLNKSTSDQQGSHVTCYLHNLFCSHRSSLTGLLMIRVRVRRWAVTVRRGSFSSPEPLGLGLWGREWARVGKFMGLLTAERPHGRSLFPHLHLFCTEVRALRRRQCQLLQQMI